MEGEYNNFISKKLGIYNISQSSDLKLFKEDNVLRYNLSYTVVDEYNGGVLKTNYHNGTLKKMGQISIVLWEAVMVKEVLILH